MSTRNRRRADGKLRPSVRRYRARREAAKRTPEEKAARRAWLDNFEPGARTKFFKLSKAPAEAIFLRAFARKIGIPQEEAAPLLERAALERGWMKLRTRDGTVVGIAPPLTPANPRPTTEERRRRVYCTQFASCRWAGYRHGSVADVKERPCPRCGKSVAT